MSLHSFTISEEAATYASTAAQDEHETADERRATTRADAAWHDARGIRSDPALTNLDIGGDVKDWHDRFLIRSDHHMPHAVFIACGTGLQSSWQMKRLGAPWRLFFPTNYAAVFRKVAANPWQQGRLYQLMAAIAMTSAVKCCFAAS